MSQGEGFITAPAYATLEAGLESILDTSTCCTGACERSRWLFYVPMLAGTFASLVSVNIFITAGCGLWPSRCFKRVGPGTFGSPESSCRALAARNSSEMGHRELPEAFMAGVLHWMSVCWPCARALPLASDIT